MPNDKSHIGLHLFEAAPAVPLVRRTAALLLAMALTGALCFLLVYPASAQTEPPDECPGGGYDPVPVNVEVTAIPIVVESTTDEYSCFMGGTSWMRTPRWRYRSR